ncbi:uncharacterized protein LOC117815513 [Xyrichtys novacula]|uniref:Uncharacterized protein LOC117815513 n=1 Tax=Xyrichtys novacula TaxID=13765 RepID=A0AAV1EYQ2_XYRNO|nr:uncharacterized protein LOC117815513 [Xyrichtys novacula]
MHCTGMKNLLSNLLPVLALAAWFIEISGSTSLRPVLTGPDLAYLSSRVAFRCSAPGSSTPITYELLKDDSVLIDTDTDFEGGRPAPFFLKVSATTEGTYYCRVTAGASTGVSNSIKLSIVTPPLNTRIFSDPSPPVAYEGSHIILSCNVSKGSHLSYTWFFNKKEVTPSTSPFLHLTGNRLVLENVTPEHAGSYYCVAWSQIHDIRRFTSSSDVLVTVKVPVGGDVKLDIEYLYRADFQLAAATLSCDVSRGTFPQISWLFNDSVLPSEAPPEGAPIKPGLSNYALGDNSQTLVLTRIGPEESGYYNCRARNSYDDSGPWVKSEAVLVRVTEVFMTTMEALSIGFCCFVLLTLVVGLTLIYWMLDQDQGVCSRACKTKLLVLMYLRCQSPQPNQRVPRLFLHLQTVIFTISSWRSPCDP